MKYSPFRTVALVIASISMAGFAPAQEPEYSVYVFRGDLTAEFYDLLAAAEEADAASEMPEDAGGEEAASDEDAADQPIAISGDMNDEDVESSSGELSELSETSTPSMESTPSADTTDEAVAEPAAIAKRTWLSAEEVVAAVSASAILRAALESPLDDEATWQPAKRMVMSPLGAGSRQGAIVAVDSQLRIKQLETDLTDHIVTAVDALIPPAGAASPFAAGAAAEQRAVLLLLRAELARATPSAVAIDLLLRRLAELQAGDAEPIS